MLALTLMLGLTTMVIFITQYLGRSELSPQLR
jgi:hypothetical protein